jgi:ribosomal protein S18 acetylase RimI-like enzyme
LSIKLTDLPAEDAKRRPRYGAVPAALIGRLAVDRRFRSQGLGGALIIDAVSRPSVADAAIHALLVDAKDEQAADFYEHLGFRRFGDRPMSLFLPIATALTAIQAEG